MPLFIFFLKESLWFLYVHKKYDEFFKEINEIITINNYFVIGKSYPNITYEEV